MSEKTAMEFSEETHQDEKCEVGQTVGSVECGATGGIEDAVEHSEDYKKLVDYGITAKVAAELEKIFLDGLLTHEELDDRALDALKEFPADGGVAVIREFACSNLEHVSNKSAFLCGVMKTYRQKNKMGIDQIPSQKKGPDEAKLKEIRDRTGYSLDVTTGQRKYGGPPPNCDPTQPGAGHEVFCGKIPKDIFEDELIPLFEACGHIWDLRLMMEPLTGLNRGFCFVTFTERAGAQEAVRQLDNHEIRKGKQLKVNISVANVRLFVGNIPKCRSKDEIREEFCKYTDGLLDVIIYCSPDNMKKQKNRGFAFLEYESHKTASLAKRKLAGGRIKVWGCDIIVDWADPMEEPDEDTMSRVKVLYVRNLKADVTEDDLKSAFSGHCVQGKVERVKKIKDYGFIHFDEREDALQAMAALHGTKIHQEDEDGPEMEVSLAKPVSDARRQEKRKRWNEMRQYEHGGDIWGFGPPAGVRGGGGGLGGPRGRWGGGSGAMPRGGGYGGPRGGAWTPAPHWHHHHHHAHGPRGPWQPPMQPAGGFRGGRGGGPRGDYHGHSGTTYWH